MAAPGTTVVAQLVCPETQWNYQFFDSASLMLGDGSEETPSSGVEIRHRLKSLPCSRTPLRAACSVATVLISLCWLAQLRD